MPQEADWQQPQQQQRLPVADDDVGGDAAVDDAVVVVVGGDVESQSRSSLGSRMARRLTWEWKQVVDVVDAAAFAADVAVAS